MFDNEVSILIPYKTVNSYRSKNWEWIKRRYETIMPNAEICMGDDEKEPFSKSVAVNDAAKKATRDIFIIADADIVFNIDQIKKGIEALNFSPWVIPYICMRYINAEKTDELYKKDTSIMLDDADFQDCSKVNNIGGYKLIGGINIVSRKNFEKVGGFDERFVGWGGEDDAFQKALDAICGRHFRVNTTIWHLYHPHDKPYNTECRTLIKKYYKDKKTILDNFKNSFK